MSKTKISLQNNINELIDHAVYLQIMGSFVPGAKFRQIKEIVTSTHDFIKNSSEEEVKNRLPELWKIFNKMSSIFMTRFPLKRELRVVASEFNEFFKTGNDVYSYGLEFGWLDAQMDLRELHFYSDTPYHYRIGLAAHKGNGSIEEEFLLKDAFSILVKAKYYHKLLFKYGNKLKTIEQQKGKNEFTQAIYHQITDIKFEVAAHSRLSIISFYAFVEAFVNSVGHSYLIKNTGKLDEAERELLNGFKKGRFLQLKSKNEKFQSIIREDKRSVIIVSDNGQIPEDFKFFFEYYEQLRNSAMHYSPLKERIWMKPQDWIDKASDFSKLAMKIALDFWNACYPNSDGPEYLGKLDHSLHVNKANIRAKKIKQIELASK
ncbi:hypothetical protein DYBT9275_05481 [Dyadobacter sp. CECT 9275]|uniref:Uncharacterized protein n=1 Tax=Dyadobacter helix TaxID=2822344 RepID=A0A916JIJ0_9BACT|nr:hypothetical protein [Dyadobacter sp. CECT 9275]CAG5016123.1 hypothetical protein DYBT9275_05481 [Dyadobacter sp. CECT 9275]